MLVLTSPVLPASERQHCTQRQRGVGNKKRELGSGAAIEQPQGPALLTHVSPILPVLAPKYKLMSHPVTVHMLYSCSYFCHAPTTCQTQDI